MLMSLWIEIDVVFGYWAFGCWLSNYLSDSSSNCYSFCLHQLVMLNGAVTKSGVFSESQKILLPNAKHRDYCSGNLTVCCK